LKQPVFGLYVIAKKHVSKALKKHLRKAPVKALIKSTYTKH
jgi:hypothetical protein